MTNEKNSADPLDLPAAEVTSTSPSETGDRTDAALSDDTTSSVSLAGDAAPQEKAPESVQESAQDSNQEGATNSADLFASGRKTFDPLEDLVSQAPLGHNHQIYGSQGSSGLNNAAFAPSNMQPSMPYAAGQHGWPYHPQPNQQVWGQPSPTFDPSSMGGVSGSVPPAGYQPHIPFGNQVYPRPNYAPQAGEPLPPNVPNGYFGAPNVPMGQGGTVGLGAPNVPLYQGTHFEPYQGNGQNQQPCYGTQPDMQNLPLLVKSADGRIFVKGPKGQGMSGGMSSANPTTPSPSVAIGSNASAGSSSASNASAVESAHGDAQASDAKAPTSDALSANAVSANAQVRGTGAAGAVGATGSGTTGVTGATGASGGFGAQSSQSTQGVTGFEDQNGGSAANSGAVPFVYKPPKNFATQGYTQSAHTEKWYDNLGVHILFVCLISLVLLIPASFFSWVLDDRMNNQLYAVRSMTEAWGSEQMLADPELIIPVLESAEIESEGERVRSKVRKDYRYIRPKHTQTDLKIVSEKRYKGNYEASLYTIQVEQTGYFNTEDGLALINSESNIEMMEQNETRIGINISDNKGIDEIKNIEIAGTKFEAAPSDEFKGFEVRVPTSLLYTNNELHFKFSYMVRGSQSIKFFSLSQVSEINIDAQGAIPNFMGSFLPREREVNVNDRTFTAKYYQNNIATGQAMVSAYEFTNEQNHIIIGLDDDADSYVMIMRLTKYVLLVIAITFVTVLAFEIVSHRLVSLVQYVVIGVALIMFYLLLLALSEHINFELSYIVGALVLSSMIALYVKAAFNSKKHAVCLLLMLLAMYAVLYAIVHIEAYALLVGTVILVIMLGIVMYITRHINQKGHGIKSI